MYDVNGDRLTDVVTSLAAHDFGLAWFAAEEGGRRQRHVGEARDRGGLLDEERRRRRVLGAARVRFVDMNGDKIPDFIVGKRYWSHLENYNGPDPYGPAAWSTSIARCAIRRRQAAPSSCRSSCTTGRASARRSRWWI